MVLRCVSQLVWYFPSHFFSLYSWTKWYSWEKTYEYYWFRLFLASIPLTFWDEAIFSKCLYYWYFPSNILINFSPLEFLFGIKPDYHFLKVFGCYWFPWLRPYTSHKLEDQSKACTFLGYSPRHKEYKCLAAGGWLFLSWDVIFYENCFLLSHFI